MKKHLITSILLAIVFNVNAKVCFFTKDSTIKIDTVWTNFKKNPVWNFDNHSKIYLVLIDTTNNTINSGVKFEGLVLNSKKHGEWLRFQNDTIKSRINYKLGKIHGSYIEYFNNGKPKIIRSFYEGKLGSIISLYNNGQINSYSFYNYNKSEEWIISSDLCLMSEEVVFDSFNRIIIHRQHPTLDSLRFNSAPCGIFSNDIAIGDIYGFVINDSTYYTANSYYKNGSPRIISFRDVLSDTLNFEYYLEDGNLVQTGQLIYICHLGDCCWRSVGKWIYYKDEEIIEVRYRDD
jgi:antitoxin component YwqK of YwqJK toxin-antitoxin module